MLATLPLLSPRLRLAAPAFLLLTASLGLAPGHSWAQADAGANAIRIQTPSSANLPPISWQAPPAAELEFEVRGLIKGISYQAQAQLSWQPVQGRYEAAQTLRLPLLGNRRQSSVGKITPQGLQPEVFMDAGRREYSVSLDAQQGRIHFSRPNSPSQPWIMGTQDRLSVFFQIAGMLAAAPTQYPAGTAITMDAVSKSSLKPWTFIVRGTEQLALPAGKVQALKLEHISGPAPQTGAKPTDDGPQQSALWLAPSWGYLPVRIRLQESEQDSVDLLLKAAPSTPTKH